MLERTHTTMTDDPAGHRWHVDRRIPVTLITSFVATALIQTFTAVWWARGQSAALEQAMIDQSRLETRLDRIETERDDIKARMIRVEEKISNQTNALIDQGQTLKEILRQVTTAKH